MDLGISRGGGGGERCHGFPLQRSRYFEGILENSAWLFRESLKVKLADRPYLARLTARTTEGW